MPHGSTRLRKPTTLIFLDGRRASARAECRRVLVESLPAFEERHADNRFLDRAVRAPPLHARTPDGCRGQFRFRDERVEILTHGGTVTRTGANTRLSSFQALRAGTRAHAPLIRGVHSELEPILVALVELRKLARFVQKSTALLQDGAFGVQRERRTGVCNACVHPRFRPAVAHFAADPSVELSRSQVQVGPHGPLVPGVSDGLRSKSIRGPGAAKLPRHFLEPRGEILNEHGVVFHVGFVPQSPRLVVEKLRRSVRGAARALVPVAAVPTRHLDAS